MNFILNYPMKIFLMLIFSISLSTGQSAIAQDANTVEIEIVMPNGQVQQTHTLTVGETLELKGLPFPMHKLNGGELHLPEESIKENIKIEISLPEFSNVAEQAQEVGFGPKIANAIEVNVYVDGDLVSPYEFEVPVELTMPVPENRPDNMGNDISSFILAYTKDGDSFDTREIATTVQDTVKGIIKAEVGHFSIIAITSDAEEEESYLVEIEIVMPNGQVQQTHTLTVGETLELKGLPFPMHKLNGGELHLPEEAIKENIKIEIGLPEFSNVSEQTQEVGFGPKIANAIEVNVYVDGDLVSPYEFEVPVELTLPVPENRPANMGSDISNFILAYTKDGDSFDTREIATTVQDTVKGIIKAEVGHFSIIAMTGETEVTSADDEQLDVPGRVHLDQNYPNPFNPVTTIGFELPERAEITLRVYNTLGQEVATLKNSILDAGSHSVMWDATSYSSGVYIYKLEVNGQVHTRQMSLIK